MKLYFHPGEWVQSTAELKALNLMLVFQVNCPGCLIHAFPLLESIAQKYSQLNVFALSTAFEDFALNTAENTHKLIKQGELTQASKRYYERLGQKRLPYAINTPVVMDTFMNDAQVNDICQMLIQQFEAAAPLSPQVSQQIKNQLNQRILPSARTGRTFLNNQMQGTPSWYLFNQELDVLDSWFGHKDPDWVESTIKRNL